MIDPATIENALYDWIYGATGVETILADENAPRPTGSYVLFNIINSMPVGFAGKLLTRKPLDLVQFDYSTTYDLFVSINFYRTDALKNASILRDSLDKIGTIEDLTENGLFFISTSDIRHIPDVVKKKIEERYQFDVSFYIRSLTTEILEQIKKVEITNELDGSTKIIEES